MLGDEMARCVGRMWERMCILRPGRPTSAVKYLQTLYGTKKFSPATIVHNIQNLRAQLFHELFNYFPCPVAGRHFQKFTAQKESIHSQRKSRTESRIWEADE